MDGIEKRVIQGWRTRFQQEREGVVSEVMRHMGHTTHGNRNLLGESNAGASPGQVEYHDLNKSRRRQASDTLAGMVRQERRIRWAEMDSDVKAKIIQRSVENTRSWRAANRERFNANAAQYNRQNRDKILLQKRARYAEKTTEHDRLIAAIYQQILSLAGLSSWQKKPGGMGEHPPCKRSEAEPGLRSSQLHRAGRGCAASSNDIAASRLDKQIEVNQ